MRQLLDQWLTCCVGGTWRCELGIDPATRAIEACDQGDDRSRPPRPHRRQHLLPRRAGTGGSPHPIFTSGKGMPMTFKDELDRTAEAVHDIVDTATAVRGERFGCLLMLTLNFASMARMASIMTMTNPHAHLLQH